MSDEEIKQVDPAPEAKNEPMEEDFKDKYFRTLAEMENMRKRMQKEKQEISKFAVESAMSDFLPALDNLENALSFANQAGSEVKSWAVGFQMILAQLKEAVFNQGIVPFHSEGVLFDPLCHEAVEVVETNEHPEGTILKEFSKGYKGASGRIVRAARVQVAKPTVKTEETITNQSENNHG